MLHPARLVYVNHRELRTATEWDCFLSCESLCCAFESNLKESRWPVLIVQWPARTIQSGDSALSLPVCEHPRVCGLPLLGVTRSHLHHQHKYSVNSCSWWEQSRHVSWHTWHLGHPVPAWLLQHLPRGQHCCSSLAWASKGKILLSCWQQNRMYCCASET